MRWFQPATIALVLLSGCLGGGSSDDGASTPAGAALADGNEALTGAANNTTLPTLGPAIDPWFPGETERLLVEETVTSGPPACTGPVPEYGQVWGGCVNLYLPDGTLVPEGTAAIRIEGDASGAQRQGKWGAFVMSTRVRGWVHGDQDWSMGEPTAAPTGSWRFELEPRDWDSPAQPLSSFFFHFMGHGDPANLLNGPVAGRVVAERDLNWTPTAPLDHFRLPELHKMPQPGVITMLDANLSLAQPGTAATAASGRPEVWTAAEDKLPLGAATMVVGASWTEIGGCPPAFACSLRVDTGTPTRDYGGYSLYPPAEVGAGHVVYLFAVPEDMTPEPDVLDASLLSFWPYVFNQCPGTVDQNVGDCKRNFADATADVRLRVEAWEDDVDLAAFKSRLGVA